MKVQLRSTKSGMKSRSLKRLAQALTKSLGYKVWRTVNTRAHRRQFMYGDAVDKLTQYRWFEQQGLSALEYTTDRAVALKWRQEGHAVFGRLLLNASCGDGIVIWDGEGKLANQEPNGCPVYTKYKKKKREFRVHVFKERVVAIVEKKKRIDWAGGNHKIRNLANGYVFCQEVDLSPELGARIQTLALAAAKVSGSDFKGVDLGYNEKNDDLFVIEVNSAPGIEGTNVERYVEVIKQYV